MRRPLVKMEDVGKVLKTGQAGDVAQWWSTCLISAGHSFFFLAVYAALGKPVPGSQRPHDRA